MESPWKINTQFTVYKNGSWQSRNLTVPVLVLCCPEFGPTASHAQYKAEDKAVEGPCVKQQEKTRYRSSVTKDIQRTQINDHSFRFRSSMQRLSTSLLYVCTESSQMLLNVDRLMMNVEVVVACFRILRWISQQMLTLFKETFLVVFCTLFVSGKLTMRTCDLRFVMLMMMTTTFTHSIQRAVLNLNHAVLEEPRNSLERLHHDAAIGRSPPFPTDCSELNILH